jgi:hypothetical protein
MISGCQNAAMKCMYTKRHNEVARILLKAISKGRYGSDLCSADVGAHHYLEADQLEHLSQHRGFPQAMLPPGTKPADLPSRPDAVILSNDSYPQQDGFGPHLPADFFSRGSRRSFTVTLIEIKVCHDTKPEDQAARAAVQHSGTIAQLRPHYKDVRQVTILVGARGTIYDSTLDALRELGVPTDKAKKALAKAHKSLCEHLQSIVSTRRFLEHQTAAGLPNLRHGGPMHARRAAGT